MGIGVELWRARIGLFCGGRGCRPRKATQTHKLHRDDETSNDTANGKNSTTNCSCHHSHCVWYIGPVIAAIFVASLLLLLAGDVELNPGPGRGTFV